MLKSRSLDKQFNAKSATNLPLTLDQALDHILSWSIKLETQTPYTDYLDLIPEKHYMLGPFRDILDTWSMYLDT